jgi:hypothetical protein
VINPIAVNDDDDDNNNNNNNNRNGRKFGSTD